MTAHISSELGIVNQQKGNPRLASPKGKMGFLEKKRPKKSEIQAITNKAF